jgi:hypothetical protein
MLEAARLTSVPASIHCRNTSLIADSGDTLGGGVVGAVDVGGTGSCPSALTGGNELAVEVFASLVASL